jgi:integrase
MSVRKREWKTAGGISKQAFVVDYIDGSGVRRLKTFKTQTKAREWANRTAVQVYEGTHVPDRESITVAEAAEIWFVAVKQGRNGRDPAEPATLRQYRNHVDRHIVTAPVMRNGVGSLKLSHLTAPRVGAFRDHLLATISRPLAKKVLTSLKSIIGEAQSRGLVTINAASAVKIHADNGSRHKEPIVIPECAEIAAVRAKLDELASQQQSQKAKAWRRYRALIETAIHTGCRASELRGLPWAEIHFDRQTIVIKQRADENGTIGSPKSVSSRREIIISAALVALLKQWKLECPPGSLAFPNWQGRVESLANIHTRCWKPLQRAAGLVVVKRDDQGNAVRRDGKPMMVPKYNFHSLRHFHASLLIADGANPKEVQVEMGHSTITVTYDLYGHLFRDGEAEQRRRDRAERLAGALA